MPMNGFEVVDSWLTPTVLFCVLNLTIVTIFILKPHAKLKKLADIDQYTPVRIRPFLFERVQSINPSTYQREPQPDPDHQETHQPKLVRVQSLVELVKPIKISLFGSKSKPDPVHKEHVHVTRSRSDFTGRKEMKNQLITSYYHEKSLRPVVNKVLNKSVSDTSPVDTYLPQLVQVQSLFEPIKLSLFGAEPQPDPVRQDPSGHHAEPVHEHDAEKRGHVRSRSDMVRKEMKPVKKVLRKSVSQMSPVEAEEAVEQRRPETVREKTTASQNGDEAVDAKADDFINRFRKQLQLQRLAPHFEMHGNVEQRDWEVSGGIELLG